jgi:Transcriptional regulator/sugar kinase
MRAIAIDIGGSSIKSCLIENPGSSSPKINKIQTHKLHINSFSEIERTVINICTALFRSGADKYVGISTSGSVDNNGTVVSAGNFKDYVNVHWGNILSKRFDGITVRTVNDGRASAWGEYSVAVPQSQTHVHVVVGTGVGGGIIYDGVLLTGDSGQAGYIGHTKLTSLATIVCSCGKTGCTETLSSSRGILANYFSQPDSLIDNTDIEFDMLLDSYHQDPEGINKALHTSGYWLGVSIGNVMNILNPQIVTIGGGVLDGIIRTIPNLNDPDDNPYIIGVQDGATYAAHRRVRASGKIVLGSLGNTAGLIGAASLVKIRGDEF